MFLVAGGQPSELLQPIHQPLDTVAQAVNRPVEGTRAAFVALAGNRDPDPPAPRPAADRATAIALVAHDPAWPATRAPTPCPLDHPAFHPLGEDHGFMALAGREHHGHGPAGA